MLKVIIDYDDVLNDCNQAAIEKLNKEEGTRFLLSDIHKWGITRTLLDKRIEYFKDPLFMSTVPLRKGAKKFIKQLSKRYEVFIATSVHPDCAGVRVNEIIHEFPCVRPENILIGQRKDLLMADVLLDDAYHNICSSLVKYPILYKRPWNEHITGIPKIESYEEFLNTLLILDRNKRPTYKNIFILVGPSASGKSSLVDKLMQKDCNISKTISYTTRPPRYRSEPYNFISVEEFNQLKKTNFFVETTEYKGAFYGTAYSDLEQFRYIGKKLIAIMDINGALNVKRHYPDNTSLLYIDRPKEDCIRSILQRTISIDEIVSRISSIDEEQKNKKFCDYIIQNNKDLNNTVNEILHIMEDK